MLLPIVNKMRKKNNKKTIRKHKTKQTNKTKTKTKTNKNTTVGRVPKSDRKLVETEAKLIPLRHTYMTILSLSWFGTDTSIKSGEVKLVLWTKTTISIRIFIQCNMLNNLMTQLSLLLFLIIIRLFAFPT